MIAAFVTALAIVVAICVIKLSPSTSPKFSVRKPPKLTANAADAASSVTERLNAWKAELSDRFGQIDGFISRTKTDSTAVLLEGVPHPTWEAALREREIADKRVILVGGETYYELAQDLDGSDRDRLGLILSEGAFEPWGWLKSCGGYHGDWCLLWGEGEEQIATEFCFGCGEATVWHRDFIVLCDIKPSAENAIVEVLSKYQHLRPED